VKTQGHKNKNAHLEPGYAHCETGLAKGQLISKCLFGAIVSTKKPTKIF
jgi:hypothetical protein